MCNKAVDTCSFIYDSAPDQLRLKKCDKVVFKEPFMNFMIKTQEMCEKAVDVCLPALTFVPDWFITNKMLEKRDIVFSNNDIVFVNEDSDVTFFSDMCLNTIYSHHINLGDDNFDS